MHKKAANRGEKASNLGKSPHLFIQRNPSRCHQEDTNIFRLSSRGMDTAKDVPEGVLRVRNALTAISAIRSRNWKK
jgi:hypothetical protein